MDEVRIWKVVRSQDQIIKHMRWSTGLENDKNLVAYWKFNDPDTDNGQFRCRGGGAAEQASAVGLWQQAL
jgi:hypothetical protein